MREYEIFLMSLDLSMDNEDNLPTSKELKKLTKQEIWSLLVSWSETE